MRTATVRRSLPDERPAIVHHFDIAGLDGYIIVGLYPEDHLPGELFVVIAKEGSTISGLADGFAIAISDALQYGVPLRKIVDKYRGISFEPAGRTRCEDIPEASSLYDYIARWLEIRFLQTEAVSQKTEVEVLAG